MSDTAIQVQGLSKLYQIGASRTYKTVRESMMNLLNAPFRAATRAFGGQESPDPSTQLWALKDVSFDVAGGEVVGIIGRNGAGKSTLLKVLSQITEPTTGRIKINGRVGSLLEVGTGFHPELTGRENIYLNGAILGMKRWEITKKFDEIVSFSEIEKFIDTPVKRYSSGMYTRLAFAVAANLDPEILVVDEVLAVGDAQFQKKCLGKMKDVAGYGRTVLFVSHNMRAVEQLCTRVIALDKGKVSTDSTDVPAAIKTYLFSGEDNATDSSQWVNDGTVKNEWFQPSRFFLSDASGNPIPARQRGDEDIWINIDADVAVLDPALTVGYAIYSEEGQLLYWSYQTDTAEQVWPKLNIGPNRLRSKLPPRLFNEGCFRLELIGGLTNRKWLFEPGVSAPSLFLTIQGGLSDSPLWMTRRPGILAPVIQWWNQ